MCGHSSLHHVRVPHNHQQEMVVPASGPEYAQPYAPTQVTARPCPQCSAPAREDFVFCPRCGTELLTACPECHRAVETTWPRCAYCGADLTPA